MNCKKIERLLVLYLDDVISEKDKKKIEKHFQECINCRKTFEDFKKIKNIILELPVEQPPQELITKIQTKLNEVEQEKYFVFIPIRILVPVTAFVFVTVCLFYFLTKQKIVDLPSIPEIGEKKGIQPITIAEKEEKPNVLPTIPKPTKVAEIKIDLPENDVVKIEEMLLASAKSQVDELQTRGVWEQPLRLRGPKIQQKIIEEFKEKLDILKLTFVELTPELKEIYERRYKRYPTLKRLKTNGYIGENNTAQLSILDEEKLTAEEKKLIEEENNDRQKMLEVLAKQYIEKKKLPLQYQDKVSKKIKMLLTKIFHQLCEQGEFIQRLDGKWERKI